ncbi:Z1 domain-containing protein [Cellulophaga baltica 4]|nr:Z1 domain-containing protein [Cellulophaga baltica 4]
MGVVADLSQEFRNRTMMVHPSRLTNSQRIFFDWIRNVSESWVRLLESSDEDEKNVLLMEFKVAYDDLNLTVGSSLPKFEILTSTRLIHSIKNTRIIEVNASSGRTPEIRWNDFYSHILIGGQAMDRGFTVEGLTVTYMPRSLATGQIDTTLQRARFFGYKGAYLGFCRVWVDQNNIDAYVSIIEHEEDVRRRLEEYDLNNKHLNEWDRELVKDRILRLTRPNIIYDDLDRDYFGSEWFVIRAPHDSDNLIHFNKSIISEFFNNNIQSFNLDVGHLERTEGQKHLIGEISLSETLKYLLNRLKFTKETESQTFSSLRGLINSYLNETPDETCLVYAISSNKVGDQIIQKIRERRLNANDEIQQLFQGEQPTRNGTYRKGEIYPGDRNLRNNEKLTIQIHRLKLKDTNGEDILDENGTQIYDDVPSIAIWIPESIGKDIVRQPENIL